MTAALYCAARDLYANGLPRGSIPNPARLIEFADSVFVFLTDHGFETGDLVRFRKDDDSAVLPPEIAIVDCFVKKLDDRAFGVSLTLGGDYVLFSVVPERILVWAPLDIDGAIRRASRAIDEMIPAHAVPLSEPFPEIVTITAAELAIGYLMNGSASKSLADIVDGAQKRLRVWAAGVPIRGTDNTAERTNLAVKATAPVIDRVGWSKFGGIS